MPRPVSPAARKQSAARHKRPGHRRHPATLAADVTEDVTQIIWEGRTFHLRKPIDLTVRRKGPYYFVGYRALGIEGYGRSEQEALHSFSDIFSATWDWIATANDSQLGGEARELRRKLLYLVAEVDCAG